MRSAHSSQKKHRILPGFGLTLGFTLSYLSLLVLIPLCTIPLKATSSGWSGFLSAAFSERAIAAYGLSLGTSFCAAAINTVMGFIVAWVLVRYRFFGRTLIDGLIDLPFALPTAVTGITLTALYSQNGWLGKYLYQWGIESAYSFFGITLALTFIGLPFVVRTIEPVLQDLDVTLEEAATSLGASRWQTLRRVILPELLPALTTGFALAFARGLGEYGSVIFIAGNMPMKTEITPLLIMIKLEQFDYVGAAAIAAVFLMISFCLLLSINMLQYNSSLLHLASKGSR